MATAKKTTYINAELDWAESQISNWQKYIEDNPLHELKDRITYKETKSGAVPSVVATVEQQGKYLQDMMKNYLALLDQVNKLREKEEKKKLETRGGQELGQMAKAFADSVAKGEIKVKHEDESVDNGEKAPY